MPRAEGPRRPFAVNEETAAFARNFVLFLLAGVVRDIKEHRKRSFGKEILEDPARQMRQDLTVGERAVDARAHCAEIAFANLGADRRASEFEIWKHDAVCRCCESHLPQELGADLVAKAARAAMDADDDVAESQAEGRGNAIIPDRGYLLHFEVVIARAERAHPLALAMPRAM
jgi:hypothetical protein